MKRLIDIRTHLENECRINTQWKRFNQCNAIFIHWHPANEDMAIDFAKNTIDPLLGDNFSRVITSFGGWSWIIISKRFDDETK